MGLVQMHTDALTSDLSLILREIVGDQQLPDALALVEDATLLIRTPHNIARLRNHAADIRAQRGVAMCIHHLVSMTTAKRPPTIKQLYTRAYEYLYLLRPSAFL